jgi:exodeoxyribonuclease VII large subunit
LLSNYLEPNTPMPQNNHYTLSTILKGIKEHIESRIKGKSFWLKVEISNINIHSSGHCYLDLTETKDGKSIAKCKGTIWRSSLRSIRDDLGKDFSNVLKKGNEILCLVEVEFSELYGLNIRINSIDLSFNLGALEKKRQETIERLTKEDIIDQNSKLKVPVVIQSIAIIGSPQTAGLTDLIKQLSTNDYGYHFEYEVFSCSVQGANAEMEIISRLNQLKGSSVDVIVIVRGGGSKLDLDVFNSYEMARVIALHDKPVMTGIGHDTDISVADLVANKYHKTPSALGSFIIEKAYNFEVKVTNSINSILEVKTRFFDKLKNHLTLNVQSLTSTSTRIAGLRRGDLHTQLNRINSEARYLVNLQNNKINLSFDVIRNTPRLVISNSKQTLQNTMEVIKVNAEGSIKEALNSYKHLMELVSTYSINLCSSKLRNISNTFELIKSFDPIDVLSKGYAIPRIDGELLKKQKIQKGDEIEIELSERKLLVSYIKDEKKWTNLITKKLQKN